VTQRTRWGRLLHIAHQGLLAFIMRDRIGKITEYED
jgi:hypothetical protein